MSKASDLARLMTSGSTAIHGEAGTTSSGSTGATTTLQQGLAKLWHQTNASSGTPSTQDSFNMGSITDNGVGNFTFAFTNNMGNNDYSWTHTGVTDGTYSLYHGASLSVGTSSLQYRDNKTDNLSSAAAVDHSHICDTIHGDLA